MIVSCDKHNTPGNLVTGIFIPCCFTFLLFLSKLADGSNNFEQYLCCCNGISKEKPKSILIMNFQDGHVETVDTRSKRQDHPDLHKRAEKAPVNGIRSTPTHLRYWSVI